MYRLSSPKFSQSGAALILVLGIVALLTVMVVAFLGTSSKQITDAKGATAVVEKNQLAELAASQFLADIENEILAGSVSPAAAGSLAFYPATPLSAVPDRFNTARSSNKGSAPSAPVIAPPNLLKQSTFDRSFYDENLGMEAISGLEIQRAFPKATTYPAPPRASQISTEPSISAARWNRPLLLPRENTNAGDVFPAGYEPKRTGAITSRVGGLSTSANWSWQPPDWIYVTKTGENPTSFRSSLIAGGEDAVVGRYAYQAYDIGGLLDLNVAGYDPDVVPQRTAGKRGSIGLADLTQVGLSADQIKALVKFRNPALSNTQSTGGPYGNSYVNFLLKNPDPRSTGLTWPGNNGFMRVGNLGSTTNKAFASRTQLKSFLLSELSPNITRDSKEAALLMETLQYFTHFSRSLEQPSYRPGFYLADAAGARTRSNTTLAGASSPGPSSTPESPVFLRPSIVPPKDKVDDILYPINVVSTSQPQPPYATGQTQPLHVAFKQPYEMALGNNRGGNDAWGTLDERSYGNNPISVSTSNIKPAQIPRSTALQDVINPGFLEVRVKTPFRRMDNTQATVGEPLVKKRFPLERLSWLTYKGPSAQLSSGDPLYNSLGTVENIKKAFGLTWTPADTNDPEKTNFWVYDHGSPIKGDVLTLEEVASSQGREPDFVELLYAAIAVGSVGKSAVAMHNAGEPWDVATYQQVRDRTSRFQVLEIAANIIDQYDSDSYPTIIKLPNPYPNPDSPSATNLYPALFTARGVEDVPYFYRLQWRGVKNYNSVALRGYPDIDLSGLGGVQDITEALAGRMQLAGASVDAANPTNFICGNTSLILFPELWNPHAQGAQTSTNSVGPKEFRVVAASQTPSDVLVARSPASVSGAMAGNDRGLANNPKLYDGSGILNADLSQLAWKDASILKRFTARTRGNFLFSLRTDENYGNPDLWGWFEGNDFPTNPNSRVGFYLDKGPTGVIFWNLTDHGLVNSKKIDINTPQNSLVDSTDAFEYALWRMPVGLQTGTITALDRSFRDLRTVSRGIKVGGQYDFLSANEIALTYADNQGLDAANWYVLNDTSNGRFPLNQNQHFSDANTIRIALSHAAVVTGSPVTRHQSMTGNNAWVDFRGTELLFDNAAGTAIFREPTPLCLAGVPAGSNMRAGDDNFFSSKPYNGGVDDGNKNRWIGFSLGESPSQFISGYRLETGTLTASNLDPVTGVSYGTDSAGRPIIKGNRTTDFAQVTHNSFTSALATGSGNDTYFRFFAVPVNMVGLDQDHLMTIQIQFKDSNGIWVTYDERYLEVTGGAASQTPVLYKKQITPVADQATGRFKVWGQFPNGYIVNGQPIGSTMGIGNPLVTSYDPRSSRFGHPGRTTNRSQTSVYGYQAQMAIHNPRDSTDHGLLGLGTHNRTDRNTTGLLDGLNTFGAPSLLTANANVPAAWNMINGFTWAFPYVDRSINPPSITYPLPFDTLYQALQNDTKANSVLNAPPPTLFAPGKARTSTPYWAQWWAQGQMARNALWRKPSVNANDYGWFSRAPLPVQNTVLSKYSTGPNTVNYGTFSKNSISNFRRSGYWNVFLPGAPFQWDEADALHIGAFTENIQPKYADPTDPLYTTASTPEFRQAYADPDDVVRRAMGAFAAYGNYSSNSVDGLPMGQLSGINKDNRPVVLNRAFQSVAELAYAFRGAPWKNISFSTPETGDAALLDVFCLSEAPPMMTPTPAQNPDNAADPLVAGKINLNTKQEPVLKALLNGALKDEISTQAVGLLAETLPTAQTLIGRTSSSKAWLGPLRNVSDLAGKLFGKDIAPDAFNMTRDPVYTSIVYPTDSEPTRNPDLNGAKLTWHYTGVSADLDSVFTNARDQKNLRMREAVIRALTDGGQTRVWNIMLDLVVQTGRFVAGAKDLNRFTRESERRVWVYLAIDRLTGQILDQQVEDVPD